MSNRRNKPIAIPSKEMSADELSRHRQREAQADRDRERTAQQQDRAVAATAGATPKKVGAVGWWHRQPQLTQDIHHDEMVMLNDREHYQQGQAPHVTGFPPNPPPDAGRRIKAMSEEDAERLYFASEVGQLTAKQIAEGLKCSHRQARRIVERRNRTGR